MIPANLSNKGVGKNLAVEIKQLSKNIDQMKKKNSFKESLTKVTDTNTINIFFSQLVEGLNKLDQRLEQNDSEYKKLK